MQDDPLLQPVMVVGDVVRADAFVLGGRNEHVRDAACSPAPFFRDLERGSFGKASCVSIEAPSEAEELHGFCEKDRPAQH
ncbi:hypothetical protein AA0522_1051 [Gluconacetobacter liquefaciens NRIC 0522]|nr:hypothetical protein AA0522_1051 [Gluconacetobacter liquefaciens NRIC 0522]